MITATQETRTQASRRWGELKGLTEEEQSVYTRIPATIDYVPHDSFASPEAEEELFGEDAEKIEVPIWTHFPEIPEDIHLRRRRKTTLSAGEEATFFLRYNYARYRLSRLLVAQARRRSAARARQMILWYARAIKARASIVRANMALVLAMAKRARILNVEFAELISEGNMALLRSVEKFDVSRGFKLSTYACRSILKSFGRLATKTGRYRQHFPTEYDPELERSDYDIQKHDRQREDFLDHLREILIRNRASLSDVERTVVIERFAITSRGKGRTLAEVGKMVGLTNERVRQIQDLALRKIRSVLDKELLKV